MTERDFIRLTALISILKEVQHDYQGQTIDNIIRQIEARVNYAKKDLGLENCSVEVRLE